MALRELRELGWEGDSEARRTLQRLHPALSVAAIATAHEGDGLASVAMSYPRMVLSDERVASPLPYYTALAPRLWAHFAAAGAVSEAASRRWLACLEKATRSAGI